MWKRRNQQKMRIFQFEGGTLTAIKGYLMYTSKILGKGWQIFTASLFLWVNISVASASELHLKTPITPLTVPIDFNEAVYVETTTTAEVLFYSGINKETPDFKAYSVVDVNSDNIKNSWKIKCDWLHRTAKVTNSYTVNDQLREHTLEYTIISYDSKNVCLLHRNDNGVQVITMNSDVGSFVLSTHIAHGFGLVNGVTIWYGFCRN